MGELVIPDGEPFDFDPGALWTIDGPSKVDAPAVEAACRQLLIAIGEDPDRDGLRDTPARWARWWQEFARYDPGTLDRTFEAVTVDQLVVVRGIQVWSLCEHHLLPFTCTVTMAYLTSERVVGLSKFARIAHEAAHRLQLQERLVQNIADRISEIAGTPDVAVVATGTHTCMTMRGIRSDGEMVTSTLAGRFMEPALRTEFLTFK